MTAECCSAQRCFPCTCRWADEWCSRQTRPRQTPTDRANVSHFQKPPNLPAATFSSGGICIKLNLFISWQLSLELEKLTNILCRQYIESNMFRARAPDIFAFTAVQKVVICVSFDVQILWRHNIYIQISGGHTKAKTFWQRRSKQFHWRCLEYRNRTHWRYPNLSRDISSEFVSLLKRKHNNCSMYNNCTHKDEKSRSSSHPLDSLLTQWTKIVRK